MLKNTEQYNKALRLHNITRHKLYYASLSPERKRIEAKKGYNRLRKKRMLSTEEEKKAVRIKWNKRYANLSISQKQHKKEQQRKYYFENHDKILRKQKEHYRSKCLIPELHQEILTKKHQYYQSRKAIQTKKSKAYYKIHAAEKRLQYKIHYKNLSREIKIQISQKALQERKRHRLEVLNHYSNGSLKCALCSCTDLRILTIDHVQGGGSQHRKLLHNNKLSDWLWSHKWLDGFQVLCIDCQFIKARENNETTLHKDGSSIQKYNYNAKKRWVWQNNRMEVLYHYSLGTMTCAKCGKDDVRCLTIDHIKGCGVAKRKEQGNGKIVRWILKNNFPEDMFQVLCMGCQWIKRIENGEEN